MPRKTQQSQPTITLCFSHRATQCQTKHFAHLGADTTKAKIAKCAFLSCDFMSFTWNSRCALSALINIPFSAWLTSPSQNSVDFIPVFLFPPLNTLKKYFFLLSYLQYWLLLQITDLNEILQALRLTILLSIFLLAVFIYYLCHFKKQI